MVIFHINDVAKMAISSKKYIDRDNTLCSKEKAYSKLLEWKKNMAGKYACLLEGARRVGKSTIAEVFGIYLIK